MCGVMKDYRFMKISDVISVIIIIIIATLVLISMIEGVKLKISKYFSHNYASKIAVRRTTNIST